MLISIIVHFTVFYSYFLLTSSFILTSHLFITYHFIFSFVNHWRWRSVLCFFVLYHSLYVSYFLPLISVIYFRNKKFYIFFFLNQKIIEKKNSYITNKYIQIMKKILTEKQTLSKIWKQYFLENIFGTKYIINID